MTEAQGGAVVAPGCCSGARGGSVGPHRSGPELLEASDEQIRLAVEHASPMVLRGLLYQLTGDEEVAATHIDIDPAGFQTGMMVDRDEDVALLRRKAVELLIECRDAGAEPIRDRAPRSACNAVRASPSARRSRTTRSSSASRSSRSIRGRASWSGKSHRPASGSSASPSPSSAPASAASTPRSAQARRHPLHRHREELRRRRHLVREPLSGGRASTRRAAPTRTSSARLPLPRTRSADWSENQRYFDWVADTFGLRDDIVFDTEVRSLTWDEDAVEWEIEIEGPDGRAPLRSNAVITAVGFLNRPKLPEIEGMADFRGPSFHTARWPEELDSTASASPSSARAAPATR